MAKVKKNGTNIQRPVRLASLSNTSWVVYAEGFKHAAEILIRNVTTTFEINTVIFPIIALFRQYVELTLKEILSYGQYLEEHVVRQGGHDLKNLWAAAKSYIRKHCDDIKNEKINRVELLICELHDLDPTSEATRYPYVKSKTASSGLIESFSYETKPINLDDLAGKITELGVLLKSVANYMAVCQDFEAEFRREHYGYMDY